MIPFKKLMMVLFVSLLMFTTTQSIAEKKGAPTQTLDDVVALNAETIEAMKNNASFDEVSALLKATKQASKSVVISGPADLYKQKASSRIKKSRKAYRNGDLEEAIKLAEEGLEYYKKSKAKHF